MCLTNRVCTVPLQTYPRIQYLLDEQCAVKFGEEYKYTVSNKLLFCRMYVVLAVQCTFIIAKSEYVQISYYNN